MKQILIFILLIALLTLSNSKAHTNYDIFIKINATPNIESSLNSTPFIKIVLKMKGYYIALAFKKDLENYDNKSIQYQILSTYKPNYSYFLLKYQSIDSLIKIRRQGDITILENGISIFVYKTTNRPPKLPRDISLIAILFSKEKLPKFKLAPIITEKYSYTPRKEIIDILSKVSLITIKITS